MTKHNGEKRAIRERMVKTGERYTTARHYHLALHHAAPASSTPLATPPAAEPFPASPASKPEPVPAATDRPGPASATGAATNAHPAASAPSASGVAPVSPNADTAVAGASGAVEKSEAGLAKDVAGASPGPAEWAEDPGMSHEAITRNTGRSWNEWFALLDAWGAAERTHTEIARHINDTYDISGWWAQGVTVGYERARGRRKVYERPDGFTISVSKTFAVPPERLFAAFASAEQRDQWLEPGTLRERTSQPPRSARFDLAGTESRVHITVTAKGEQKSTVQIEEIKLAGEDQVAPRKAFWKEKLAGLNTLLTA